MIAIDYSVVIRTTGKAGVRYQALLDSISELEPAPAEVIVVLPEGYALPSEKLGYERFCFSPKGMVTQRVAGMNQCRTRYALVCDDDVAFPPDFVRKLYAPMQEASAAFSVAPLYSFLPETGKEAVLDTLMARAVPMLFHRKGRFVSVLKSTGYSYNKHLDRSRTRYYETQSAPWTCFFADVEAFRSLEFDKEVWLDAHGYSAMDDQTMFYKAWLKGLKTIAVSNAFYEHLDAGTSKSSNEAAVLYSRSFNRFVFWHRFILSQEKNAGGRVSARLAYSYFLFWNYVWDYYKFFRGRLRREDWKRCRQALKDARDYIGQKEYLDLPPV